MPFACFTHTGPPAMIRAAFRAILLGLLPASATSAADAAPAAATAAPGYRALPYRAPVVGSYSLPVLGNAADGAVLDSSGTAMSLHQAFGDRIALLSFVYTTCDDVNGCPLAVAVFQKLKQRLLERPQFGSQVRLITFSFNPEHDTPEVLARYAAGLRPPEFDWQFMTTRSEDALKPILGAYQQPIEKEVDAAGRKTGKFSHLLRVFLIDRQQRIRNIYTVSVLHPDLVLADIETLLRERAGAQPAVGTKNGAVPPSELLRAGDDKRGYKSADYRTRSVALPERRGRKADLLGFIRKPPLGLPGVPIPQDNRPTPEKVELGRKLFYDRRLSLNNTLSCAMCHIPEQGFTSQEQATPIGIEGRTVRRNAPTLYNVAYLDRLFHDGRESSLENQVWGPFLATNEMGNPSVGFVVDKLKWLHDYQGLFERAFGRGPSMETVGQAIASYERTLISGNSAFDRWAYGKQPDAVTAEAEHGFELFKGEAGCAQCHTVGPEAALFTDQQLHNTGLGFQASMHKAPNNRRVQVAPGISLDVDAALIARVAEPPPRDLGRYEITQDPADRWKYKTPSLRNIALTAPYMHDGSLATLKDVLAFYNQGGIPNEGRDPRIKPLHLTPEQIDALVALLESLTGDNVATLVLDAYAAPLGDPD